MRSIEDIVTSLAAATDQGKIAWTVGDRDRFVAQLSDAYQVQVRSHYDEDRDQDWRSAALSKQGVFIDEVRANQYSAAYADLCDLYDAARRSANKVDAVIKDVQSLLSRM